MPTNEQQFLKDLKKKLWTATERLRSNLDVAVYKHPDFDAKDIFRHVYGYFLGRCVLAEGIRIGRYTRPNPSSTSSSKKLEHQQLPGGIMISCGKHRNAEKLRMQSLIPRSCSALSASPRFETSVVNFNTQIPACIWFLPKTKQKRGRGAAAFPMRTGEVLFIGTRKLGYMVDRVLRAFTDEDTNNITSTYHAWKRDKDAYEDIPGFYKSATLDEIAEHGYVLTPGRTSCAEEVEDEGIPFADKMALTSKLIDQFAESVKLEKSIRKNMKVLGFELPVEGKK